MSNQPDMWSSQSSPSSRPASPGAPVWMWVTIAVLAVLVTGLAGAFAVGALSNDDVASSALEAGGNGSASDEAPVAGPTPTTGAETTPTSTSVPAPPPPAPTTPPPPPQPTATPVPPTPTPTPDGLVLTWLNSAFQFDWSAGEQVRLYCPPNGDLSGNIWGGGLVEGIGSAYTSDSSICTAAVQRGLITVDEGGSFTLEPTIGLPFYRGVMANGVTSQNYPADESIGFLPIPVWPASFILYD